MLERQFNCFRKSLILFLVADIFSTNRLFGRYSLGLSALRQPIIGEGIDQVLPLLLQSGKGCASSLISLVSII